MLLPWKDGRLKRKGKAPLDSKALVAAVPAGQTTRELQKGDTVFAQGDPADAVFFVQRGKLKLTVLSTQGKQAVTALLGPGRLLRRGLPGGQPMRMATAAAMTEGSIVRLPSDR